MRLTLILPAVVLAVSGCTGTVQPPAPTPGVLTVGMREPADLLRDRMIVGAMWTPLLDYDPATGKSTPVAAESVTSSDQITWTITLRPGRYHDGAPLTAKSYVDAWGAVKQDRLFPVKEIVPVDERTIRLVMSRPSSQVPAVLASPLALPVRPGGDPRNPIGNGPFRLAAPWEPGKGGRLVRVNNVGSKAQEIQLRVFADPAAAYDEVKAGRLDLSVEVPSARHDAMHQDFAARHVLWAKPEGTYLFFGPDLAEPAARYAIAMSLDRKGLAAGVRQNQVDPATALIPPAVATGERTGICRPCNSDPAAAKSLLQQTGVTAMSIKPAQDPVAKALADQVRSALDVDTNSGPGPQLRTVTLQTNSPHEFLESLGVAAVSEFLDTAAASGSQEERAQMYRLAENQILRDLTVAPLWTTHGHAVWSERLHDVAATPAHDVDLAAITL